MTRHDVDTRQVTTPRRASAEADRAPQLSEEEVSRAMEASRPGSISVDEFTEATFKAVLRASEARKAAHGADRQDFKPGPIIYGIIWWPEGGPGGEGPIFAGPQT
jgi:uncharacterized membrane protein